MSMQDFSEITCPGSVRHPAGIGRARRCTPGTVNRTRHGGKRSASRLCTSHKARRGAGASVCPPELSQSASQHGEEGASARGQTSWVDNID